MAKKRSPPPSPNSSRADRKRERSKPDLPSAEQYAQDVIDGKIVVGRYVRLAVERHFRDLKEGKKRGLWFDRDDAQFAIDCFGFFKHSKGRWAGRPFQLSPWQKFIIWSIFGWKRKKEGHVVRRYTRAYIEVARKNGKSTLLAGIAIILLALDGEEGAEVYSAATKKDQARIVFAEAQRMVKASPDLKEFIKAYRHNLNVPTTNSKMEPLSSDANSLDGLNPHGAVVDELHAHKTREVWDVLDTATGARLQALLITITTAGFNQDGICYEVRGYGIDILNGTVEDDAYFFFIAAIDDEDNWQDEACWVKANPNLGISADIEDLRAKAKRAKRSASALNNFLIKHLNRWTQQAQRWISIEAWDACLMKRSAEESMQELAGRRCFGGLDLAEKIDLNALALVFPPLEGEKWRFLFRFWIPEDTIAARKEEGDFRYVEWEKEGLLTATAGNVTDYDVIRDEVLALREIFAIEQIGYDPWNATHLATQLQNGGIEMVEVPQNFRHMSEASKEFEAMVISKKIAQDGNKMMRWMVDNVAIDSHKDGFIRPIKPKDKRKKVDGVVAGVIALTRALVAPEAPGDPGVFFI